MKKKCKGCGKIRPIENLCEMDFKARKIKAYFCNDKYHCATKGIDKIKNVEAD